MRRLITAIVVPFALITAIAITATAADAGKGPSSAKSKVAIKSVSTSKATDTWVFKGKVTSKNEKCLGKRRVSIYVADEVPMRGAAPTGPVATGKTKDNGKFAADTGQELLLIAPYVAIVSERVHKGLTCKSAQSKPYEIPLRQAGG